jgi:ABC-type transport system substrate-binding protein
VFVPNPYARRKPHLQRLVLKIVPNEETAFLLLRTHAVDAVDELTNLEAMQARSISNLKLVRTEKNYWDFVAFNAQRPPTDDVRVRQALQEAIEVRSIAHKVMYDNWPVATTEIPPVLWAHDAAIPSATYDPQDAARILRGKRLDVELAYIASDEANRAIVTMVQAGLAAVGVHATLRAYPENVFFSVPNGVYYGGRFNLALLGNFGGSDPEQNEFLTCDRLAPNGPNAVRWCNRSYDRLFSQQSQLLARSARTAVFYKMQNAVHDAALFVPLTYRGYFSAVNPAVRGWEPNMLFEFSNSEDWDVTPPGG